MSAAPAMPSGSTPEEVLEKIRALPPPAQLRLAAELLERRRPRIALAVVKGISVELEALHLAGKL